MPPSTLEPLPIALPDLRVEEAPPPPRQGWRSRAATWIGLVWLFLRHNPGWMLSAAFHGLLFGAFALVLYRSAENRSELGIEAALSEESGDEQLENIMGAPAVEISASSPADQAAQQAQQAADAAAADAAASLDRLGLAGTGTGDGSGGGSTPGLGAGFFGAKGEGRSFVFIVDMSSSMTGDRFRRAVAELAKAINRLKAEQSFYVFFFNDQAVPLYDPSPAKGMQVATATNKSRASRWVRNRKPSGTTNPNMALRQALEMKPDVVFLLTDGELDDPGGVRQIIRKYNKTGVVIHTIAFENEDGTTTLKAIATENNGSFRFVR
ncbi:MAG: VWA domain-containing protein [Planctomycetales bacterium]